VVENIELPLRNDRKVSAEERRRRVEEVMGILRLGSLAERFIGELDAGTRQKVAVGRAVARHSEIILFDEPTTNVEVNAKLQLIRAFKEVARRLQQTIVYVTHDQTEAMTLADRIALMKDGKIVQCAAPRVLFDEPETDFGGWFLGNPGMNFVEGSVRAGHVESPILASPLPAAGPDGAVRVGVRPERLRLHASPQPGTVPATVFDRSLAIGGRFLLRLRLAGSGGEVKAKAPGHAAPPLGATVHVECPQDAVTVFRDGWRGEGAGPMREIA
jgi:ABC-type sugar transport system ATPase subunit